MKHHKRNVVLVVLALLVSLAMQAYSSALAVEAGSFGSKVAGKLLVTDSLMSSLGSKFLKKDPPGPVDVNGVNFPDPNFRQYVLNEFDADSNGTLSVAELDAVTSIDCRSQEIKDLTGVEHFTKLVNLDCSYNNLTSLDVSNNSALESLYCRNNDLTSLDVSNNPSLRSLDCSYNNLTSLVISNNSNLEYLNCETNKLDSLDVRGKPNLAILYCGDNLLTSLDVNNNPALIELSCWGNDLVSLVVSSNPVLKFLDCRNNDLVSLDVSNNPALEFLIGGENNLTSLDVSNNPALRYLDFSDNFVASLDVSQNPAIEVLYGSENHLTALDLIGRNLTAYAGEQVHVIPLRAEYVNGKYKFDFHQIPEVDISRIQLVEEKVGTKLPAGASYDDTSGVLTIDPNNQLVTVVYWYDTGGITTSPPSEDTLWMDVTVMLDYSFDVIYDPAGGSWPGGSTANKVETAPAGAKIKISDAPTREGYKFLYWKGSQFQPGQTYEVPVGGHTFVAVWEKTETIKPTPKLPKTGA